MKLRIRGNSLRLRLNQREVDALAAGRVLEEHVAFPGNTQLSYVLKSSSMGEPQAAFANGSIQISAPRKVLIQWASGEEIGIYFSMAAGAESLKIAIEKDLECLDGPVEEKDPYAFPRELSEKTC